MPLNKEAKPNLANPVGESLNMPIISITWDLDLPEYCTVVSQVFRNNKIWKKNKNKKQKNKQKKKTIKNKNKTVEYIKKKTTIFFLFSRRPLCCSIGVDYNWLSEHVPLWQAAILLFVLTPRFSWRVKHSLGEITLP